MIDERQLIEKLLSIERLHAGATTPGERDAAANARERIRRRLEEFVRTEPSVTKTAAAAFPPRWPVA